MSEYREKAKCPECNKVGQRDLIADVKTVTGIGDASPKTVGALADKNRAKISLDEKIALTMKHNDYRRPKSERELPSGMERSPTYSKEQEIKVD